MVEEQHSVVLSYCQDYGTGNVSKALQTVIDHLGGIGRFVSPGDQVLIKPNLIKGVLPEVCATTHPAVVEAVVRLVLDCGGRPFIGDSPAFGDLPAVALPTGITDICKRYGIPLVPFNNPVYVPVQGSWIKGISIDRAAVEADKIINLPKLKTHVQAGFTGAVKNLFGCVVGKRKPLWHFRAGDKDHRFGKMLLDVYHILNPALHIVDGIVAMEGNGPVSGQPKQLGLIAASVDGLPLDRVLCEIIGLPVSSVETLAALRKYYNRDIDLNGIEMMGAPLGLFVDKAFLLPHREPIRFDLIRIAFSVLKHLRLRLTAPLTHSP